MNSTDIFIDYEKADERTRKSMDRLFKAPKKGFWAKKRAFDVSASFIAIILLFPLMFITYILIFLDDPHASPVFRQKRVGRHGKVFTMYKFRTMVANAEELRKQLEEHNEMDGPVFKIKNDPRITRVGGILRKTGFDEILQLFNVLKGDMSLVGPRPPLVSEVERYDNYQKLRLVVTPGLTCIWQTTADRNDVPFDEWVEMDIEYIEHRTMFLDLKMIFKTVFMVFRRDGR